MEKVMSVEDKIRRAEEIYQRRKQGELRPVAKVNVNNKKDIKLMKKMLIQMLICVAIYLIIYTIQNNQYVFSEDFINKTKEILSYDINFIELYNKVKNQIMNFTNREQDIEQNIEQDIEQDNAQNSEQENEKSDEQNTEQKSEQGTEQVDEIAMGGAVEEIQPILTQGEQDIEDIKNTTSFIKPLEGVISSKYGQRDTATGSVPKNHTGIDIAANLGTKIISATDGEVVLDSDKGDYRKTLKNTNRESKHYLCTL